MGDNRSRKAVNVHIVTNNTIQVTRREILAWMGDLICKDLKRVEDLSNGSLYCLVMNKLFPGCIPFNKIRLNTRFEAEAVSNYKLLSNAFRELEVRKDIPVESLVKGVFSENFRFAQWFKLFYDANSNRSQLFQTSDDYSCEPPSPRVAQPPRRSLSISSSKDSYRLRAPTLPAGDSNQFRSRPPPTPTSKNAQATDERDSRMKTTLPDQIDGAELKKNKHEEEKMIANVDEDLSDVISIGPSEASTSEVYELPANLKKTASFELHKQAQSSRSIGNASPSSQPQRVLKNQPTEQVTKENPAQSATLPRRHAAGSHPSRNSGVQLPPPHPSPPNQRSQVSNRFSRESAISQSSQAYPHLHAAGDRPTSKMSSSNDSFPRDNVSNSSARSTMPSENYREQLVRDAQGKNRTPCENSGDAAVCKHESQKCTHTQPFNASDRTHPGNANNTVSMRELQMNHIISSEVASEGELQRELAMLRYGTIEQRRALFFCQKEAQFYFNKLRKIEDLCYQLRETRTKSREDILEMIFEILYETEEGFVCQDELKT